LEASIAAAIKQITVLPEPGAFSLILLGGATLPGRRLKGKKTAPETMTADR